MTDEERSEEGAEEAIEDLEAPAATQSDVAGGARCLDNTGRLCVGATCDLTEYKCTPDSGIVVVRDA